MNAIFRENFLNWLYRLPKSFFGNGDHLKKKGEMNMKKQIYKAMGWVSLVVGVVLFIIPGLPGIPFLLLSSYLFSI